jgi:hypothetical protein
MPPADARARLGARQEELVLALTSGGRTPEGFDAGAIGVAAASLARKRSREVARAWPALVRSLGEAAFEERFRSYAEKTPLPAHGGPLADGYAFALTLDVAGELADEARLELLGVAMRWKPVAGGLVPRRGLFVRVVRLRQARRWMLAMRAPWIGERWWRV